MNHSSFARLAGLVCLVGSLLQIIYGLLAIPFRYGESTVTWPEALWALVTVGVMGGVLGLLALGVARPRWIAVIGAALVVLGSLIRIVVAALHLLLPFQETVNAPLILILILSGILLLVLGLIMLGITTLLGKQLTGWQAWTPLLVGGFTFIPVAVYSISQFYHFILLGLWGIPWMLLGYVVFTYSAKQAPAMLVQVPGATAKR